MRLPDYFQPIAAPIPASRTRRRGRRCPSCSPRLFAGTAPRSAAPGCCGSGRVSGTGATPPGCRFGGAAGAGHGAAVALGAGLRPHSESGPHDRRSGGARNHSGGRCGRSDQLPLAGPGKLGAVKGGRKGGERKEFVILQAACLGMLSGAEVCTPVFRSPGLRIAGFPDRRGRLSDWRAAGLAGCRGFGPGRRGGAAVGPLSCRDLRAFGLTGRRIFGQSEAG